MLQADRELAAKLCESCLRRPSRGRSPVPGLVFFGVLLVVLLGVVFWFRDA